MGCWGTADHVQEQVIPLDYWGEEYVCAHSPVRAQEDHYWRVFAGDDNVTVTADPPIPGSPFNFAKRGDWIEFNVPNGTNFVLTGDGPFMPVQYTAQHLLAGGIGDAAMYQMIPTAQFLERYLFVTLGSVLHLALGTLKQRRAGKAGDVHALDDLLLFIHVREVAIVWTIIATAIGTVGLCFLSPGPSVETIVAAVAAKAT